MIEESRPKLDLSAWLFIIFGSMLLAGIVTLVTSCQTAPQAPPTPIKLSWEDGHPERKGWTDYVVKAVNENFDAFDKVSDRMSYCSNYNALSKEFRVNVWAELVSAIAKFESAWNTGSVYHEPPPLSVDSIGLLQMSIGDSYAGCPKSGSGDQLKDPIKNLECGFSAMVKLIGRDGVIAGSSKPYRALSLYWSVTRVGHHIDEIKAMTKKVPGC